MIAYLLVNVRRMFTNICAILVVFWYWLFNRRLYKKAIFENRAKVASAFMPEYVRALTACGDIKEAYETVKKKIEVPEWERFKAFLDSEEYLKDSPALQAAVNAFGKYLEPIKGRINTEKLNTFFRQNPLKEPFERAFIVIWLYNFYPEKMPEFKKEK
jgi:hypothetical protein